MACPLLRYHPFLLIFLVMDLVSLHKSLSSSHRGPPTKNQKGMENKVHILPPLFTVLCILLLYCSVLSFVRHNVLQSCCLLYESLLESSEAIAPDDGANSAEHRDFTGMWKGNIVWWSRFFVYLCITCLEVHMNCINNNFIHKCETSIVPLRANYKVSAIVTRSQMTNEALVVPC
jgi:hypothetical protein